MWRWVLLVLISLSLNVAFAAPVRLTGLQIRPSPTASRFIFLLTKKTVGRVKYLTKPTRVIVDFTNTNKNFTIQHAKFSEANVKLIDTMRTREHLLRFVFYVNGKVKWKVRFLPNDGNNGARLQLDIISAHALQKIPLRLHTQFVKVGNGDVQMPLPLPAKKTHLFTVVIDAGHGGYDPGARGQRGSEEKNIVLNIAKKLAQEINRQPDTYAVLTRNGDYFVPLGERLKLARKGKADLFIAIHADAYFNKQAKGASVYMLSARGATSLAARWLALRENHSELGGVALDALKDQSPLVRSVLIDLAQTVTARDSQFLGNNLLTTLETVSTLHYHKVERAPFLVLKSPDIPSVLVEVGFISNLQEEARLANPQYQQKIAQALWTGIQRYARFRSSR